MKQLILYCVKNVTIHKIDGNEIVVVCNVYLSTNKISE